MEQRVSLSTTDPATVADYFAAELASPERHEFRRGRIVRRAVATHSHILICGNVSGYLWGQLKGKACRVYGSSLRVRSRPDGEYVYPDATAVCGPAEVEHIAVDLESVTNPRLTVEVFSLDTEADDRGDKFDGYREIATFEQYVLVAQDQPYVQTFTRQPGGGWLMMPYVGLDAVVPLSSIGVELPLAEVYAGVTFPPRPVAK